MATAENSKNNHLTCDICKEVFTQPSTLSCQHTFCQGCLTSYIKTQTDAVKTRSILCPTCRQQTPVPQPDRPVQEWAGQMKPEVLVTGLMDSLVLENTEIQRDNGRDEMNIIDFTASPLLHEVIDGKVDQDGSSDLRDLVVMKINDMKVTVVTDTDFGNYRVKSFYTKSGKPFSSQLRLIGCPTSMSVLGQNKVILSLPWNNQIVTVGVNPELELMSTITTQKQYIAMDVLDQSTLVASSLPPQSVDVLDMTGHVVRTISPSIQQTSDDFPQRIHVTSQGNILVAAPHSVLCLTPTGQVVFTYKPTGAREVGNISDITSTTTGDIIISDCPPHKVIHIHKSGQFIKDILTSRHGLRNPYGLCVDSDKLSVATGDRVLVFQFSSK